MQNSTRINKCYTEGTYQNESIIKMKNLFNPPNTQTLTKQSKFINPYSKERIVKKAYRLQEPHSIILVSKKHRQIQSQIKMSPLVLEQEQQKQKYKTDKIIKKGLLSSVFIGFNYISGEKVGIKKIHQYSNIKNQQFHLLSKLQSQHIVKLVDHYYSIEEGRKIESIVMEYYSIDLYSFVREKRRGISQHQAVRFAYQILKGIQHMHTNSIVHRDLKSSNILINTNNHSAVIADLGSARQISFGETISGQPCPFSYRAPQVAYGTNNYSFSSDMWAFACILYEMVYKDIPFKARNNTELTIQIMSMLGTPSLQQLFEFNVNFDAREYQNFPKIKGKYPSCMNSKNPLNDLLKKLFVFCPDRRLTATQALEHQCFAHIKFNEELTKNSLSLQAQIPNNTFNKYRTPSTKRDDSNRKTIATLDDQQSTDHLNTTNKNKVKFQGRMLKMTPRIFKKLPF